MSKKSKRNKRKRNKTYSKKEFTGIFCPVCGLCDNVKKADLSFCYNSIYRANPRLFVDHVYPNLVDAVDYLAAAGKKPSDISLTSFSLMFCETGVCTAGAGRKAESCPSYEICFKTFHDQIKANASNGKKGKSRKKKNKKKREVYTPYPSFFCKSDDKFKSIIGKILHGNNDSEQDKDKELSAGNTGEPGGDPENKKS